MRHGSALPGDRPGERPVERQPQPIAGDRLMQGGVALGERERGGGAEHRPDLQVLEPRRRGRRGEADAHRSAPARASTRRADSASASSSMRSPTLTAPAPSAAARSRAARTSRASATSSSVGVNASRSASSCEGWIAHLPSKPSVRACDHAGAEVVVVARAEIRPVDRVDARGPSGHEHGLLRVAPVLLPRPAERGGEVGVADDEPVEPCGGAGDLGRGGQPGRGLDQCQQPHRGRAARSRLRTGEQTIGEGQIVWVLDLRQDGGQRLAPARGQRG